MTQDQKAMGPSWDRQQITFWINPQRRQDLMAIATGLPASATPSDALASAIELARTHMTASQAPPDELIDAISLSISNGFSDARAKIEVHGQAIREMAQGLRSIHTLLAALAGEEGEWTDVSGTLGAHGLPTSPLSFRQWLDESLTKAGRRPQRSAVARASWHAVGHTSDRLMAVDFKASLAAIDGKPVAPALAAESATVRFDLQEASHPFAKADWAAQLYLVCQPVGTGWVVHAHRAGPDGAAGSAIGQAKV